MSGLGAGSGRLHSGAMVQDSQGHSAEGQYAGGVLGGTAREDCHVGGTVVCGVPVVADAQHQHSILAL